MHASCSLLPATSIMLFVCKTTEKKPRKGAKLTLRVGVAFGP